MNSTPKAPIVVLAKVLVWVMLLHGALMIAVGLALVADEIDFSSHRGGVRFLLQCFGFPVVFAGALNMLAAVLWLRRSTYGWSFWIYLAVVLNVLLCLVALLGYGNFTYIQRELASVVFWWYCFMTLNVLLVVIVRHLSVKASKKVP